MLFVCPARESPWLFVKFLRCYRKHTASGYSGHGFGDSGVRVRTVSAGMACFLCALRENRNGFSLNACSVTENTLPAGIRAMVFEILVFVGERFLLAWHAFCVPCERIAKPFQ